MHKILTLVPMWAGLFFLLLATPVGAFNYNISSAGTIKLTDVATDIPDTKTMFTGDATYVAMKDIAWTFTGAEGGDDVVFYQTWVDGVMQAEGNFSLVGVERELPTEIPCGTIQVDKRKCTVFVCMCVCVWVGRLDFFCRRAVVGRSSHPCWSLSKPFWGMPLCFRRRS